MITLQNSKWRKFVGLSVFALALTVLAGVLGGDTTFAASKTWTGAGTDTKFSTSANWSPAGAPANGDSLIFATTGSDLSMTDDIANLTVSGITATGANNISITGSGTGTTLTIAGDVTGSTGDLVIDVSHIILAVDSTFTNVGTVGDAANLGSDLNLNGHTLNYVTNNGYHTSGGTSEISNIRAKITGSGTLVQNTPNISLFLSNMNDYSGTTNLTAGTIMTTSGDSNSVFGTSTINVGTDAAIILYTGTGASWTFNNTINIAPAVQNSDGTMFSQLTVSNGANNQQVAIPHIILNGNARFMNFGYNKGVIVNLAGIQANGHCEQYGAVGNAQDASFINGPAACIVGNTAKAPNTAVSFIMANPVVIVALGLIIAAFFSIIAFRIKASKK